MRVPSNKSRWLEEGGDGDEETQTRTLPSNEIIAKAESVRRCRRTGEYARRLNHVARRLLPGSKRVRVCVCCDRQMGAEMTRQSQGSLAHTQSVCVLMGRLPLLSLPSLFVVVGMIAVFCCASPETNAQSFTSSLFVFLCLSFLSSFLCGHAWYCRQDCQLLKAQRVLC